MLAVALFAALSAAEVAAQSVDSRIAADCSSAHLSRFTAISTSFWSGDPIFKPNTNFWLRGVDFSCASPWNTAGRNCRAGVAISKRHIIFAKHFPISAGTRIFFVGEDGGVCPCGVDATRTVADKCDIMIGLLNAEVTPNIHPAKILPGDYEKYIGNCSGLPVVTFNQREEAYVTELISIRTNTLFRTISSHKPFTKKREHFKQVNENGDSGKPTFLIFNNEPILLYCQLGANSGPGVHLFRKEIQKAMDALCPGYKLEEFDFARLTDCK